MDAKTHDTNPFITKGQLDKLDNTLSLLGGYYHRMIESNQEVINEITKARDDLRCIRRQLEQQKAGEQPK